MTPERYWIWPSSVRPGYWEGTTDPAVAGSVQAYLRVIEVRPATALQQRIEELAGWVDEQHTLWRATTKESQYDEGAADAYDAVLTRLRALSNPGGEG